LPSHITLISQEEIVSDSLKDYLSRHPEIETKISRQEDRVFYTTDSSEEFNSKATIFFGEPVSSLHADV
jgi:glutamate racemase